MCLNTISRCALAHVAVSDPVSGVVRRDALNVRLYGGELMVNPRSKPNDAQLFQRIWPPTILVLGLALTGAWIALLGYGLMLLAGSTF